MLVQLSDTMTLFHLSLYFPLYGMDRLSMRGWNLLRPGLFHWKSIVRIKSVLPEGGENLSYPCNNDKKVKALFPYAPHCGKDKLSHLNDTLQAILSGKNDKISLRILWIRHFISIRKGLKSQVLANFIKYTMDDEIDASPKLTVPVDRLSNVKGSFFELLL